MHIEQVINQMKQLRLSTMAQSFKTRLDNGDHNDLGHDEFVALLIEDEFTERRNRRLNRMIGRANFKPEQACIENINYSSARGFDKKTLLPFTTSTWIENAQNIILTGPTGSGKTYIAEAIGLHAIKMGYPAIKIRYRLLFEEINNAKGIGTYLKYLRKMATIKVLIIDDFVMHQIQHDDLSNLMDVVEERNQRGSTIITTQIPINKWHLKLPDPTVADAICDRLIHKATKINLEGESMRKSKKKSHESDR
jgi:DNA replication protein DnaC